ncbi:MAG TPA: ECF transporter S component [Candidatus Dormibacteraeota bacterium]|nr:ECF transporter S component [Candidatus Dormibacteraeota bacterium]
MTRGLPIGIVSLAGVALFAWPFIGSDLPASTPAWTLSVGCIAALLLVEAGTRQLDARGLALLAAIAAIDTALRLAVIEGIGGFSPIFFLVLCAGFVFGPTYGFLAGALSILVSALAGAGVGPWVPYQVFAVGWVGVAAGLAGQAAGIARRGRAALPGWRDVLALAFVGAVMGWVVGALLDIQDWVPVYRGNPTLGWQPGMDAATAAIHFGRFYLLTSLAYDTFRAVGNVVMVVALGAPVLAALSRLKARLSFEVVPVP